MRGLVSKKINSLKFKDSLVSEKISKDYFDNKIKN